MHLEETIKKTIMWKLYIHIVYMERWEDRRKGWQEHKGTYKINRKQHELDRQLGRCNSTNLNCLFRRSYCDQTR